MLSFSDNAIEQILDTALDAIIIIDEYHIVQTWNVSAESIFGYLREEAIGRPLYDLIIPAEFVDAHRAGVTRFVQSRESAIIGKRIEIVACRKDGARIDIELAVHVIQNTTDLYFIARCRDITERKESRKKLEAALDEKRALLLELNHRVGNILAVTSAAIRLYAQGNAKVLAMAIEDIERIATEHHAMSAEDFKRDG